MWWWIGIGLAVLLLIIVAIHDLFQKKYPVLRNFPIIGHGRSILESLGPKLRQYIVAGNNEERPFSRDQRRWIYASSNKENNYFGFGTDNDLEKTPSFLIIKQTTFPILEPQKGDANYDSKYSIPCAKVLGAARERKHAFRPQSVINVSAMSYGSLSRAAVEAINMGCAYADCLHNTGEGGVAPAHNLGAGVIWQLGTGYFGARQENGRFDEKRFVDCVQSNNVKVVEIKLSQGAKPGRGGVLPGAKVTAEISKIRGIPVGKDCLSPNAHLEFSNADELLDFVERLADLSGLPIGIKSAVGELQFWDDLVDEMNNTDRGIDYVQIDGGEGGTGAAPLTFSDHVSLPFKIGMSRVFKKFAEAGLADKVVFCGSGKLGFPQEAMLAFALGCDLICIAREAMMAIGCIQAQECHSGKCPTGVATQNKWLMRGLDPKDKSARLANYLITLRKEMLQLCHACGVCHPGMITTDHFEILEEPFQSISIEECFGLRGISTLPGDSDLVEIHRIMTECSNK